MNSRHWALAAVLGLAITISASAAAAQESDVDLRAQAHFHAATAYFDEGDYERAAVEFRAAYDASPHAELLYNIYLCEERLAHLDAAIELLQQYLASDLEIDNRSALEARLRHLSERRSRGETTTDEATGPTTEATSDEAPAPPPPPSPGPPVISIIGFTIAGVGLVAFAVLGGITLSEDARLRGSCGHGCSDADTQLIGATGIAADVSAGLALAGALFGVVGLLIPTEPAADTQVSLGPTGVSMRGSF